MTAEAVERNDAMLSQRIAGATLREIAETHGVTEQTVHRIVDRQARRHIEEVVAGMWAAQKENALLVLLVPPGLDGEQALTIRYLDWVLSQMPSYVDPAVHYRPAGFGGGFVLALEDRAFTSSQEAHR